MNTKLFTFVKPVPINSTLGPIDRKRIPRSGPKVNDPRTIELREFKAKMGMTTEQLASALSKGSKEKRISQETMQAYLQGYIASDQFIDSMIIRIREYVAESNPAGLKYANMSMKEIIDGWFASLAIDPENKDLGCPWRRLGKIVGKDHSTLFRWYRDNRKPRSVETIMKIEESINDHIVSPQSDKLIASTSL